jgi:O-methyltransferase involved in polyketide biosynthesis
MDKKNKTKVTDRNFDTISPSAKSLLLIKGHTNIPYARQTAELLLYPEKYIPDFDNPDFIFWARTLHFENRYWSIDNLLTDLNSKNILELSSGFSFRGLEASKEKDIYYIDTDLSSVIDRKKELISYLKDENDNASGTLELLPLNTLNKEAFLASVNHFPPGKIVIVNEGLLIYLNDDEKEKLCKIIREILSVRGGYWITADVYIKNQFEKNEDLKVDKDTSEFREQHKIEENKFSSFDEAENFFNRMGFEIDKEANVDPGKLSSLKYILNGNTDENFEVYQSFPKTQKTWRLKLNNR